MLTHLLEKLPEGVRHYLMKKLGIYEALHDEEWFAEFCCFSCEPVSKETI